MQGRVGNALQSGHHIHQRFALVQLGQAYVDVQNMCAGILLADAFVQNIVQIMCAQSLFQAFFAGGVDALANQNRAFAKSHRMGIGSDHGTVFGGYREGFQVLKSVCKRADMLRRCAATAAQNSGAGLCRLPHQGGKFGRGKVIDRFSVLHARQTGIRLADNGQGRNFQIPLDNGQKPRGTFRAVDANGIGSQPFQNCNHCIGVGAGHQFAVAAVGVGNKNWKIAVFFGGKQSGFGLVGVAHGFNHNQVGAVAHAKLDLRGEQGNSVLKIQVAQRFEEPPGGADVHGDEFGLFGSCLLRCFPRQANGRPDDRVQLFFAEMERICPEGVGIHHVGAGAQIGGMDAPNRVGVGQIPKLGALANGKPLLLQKCAHSAVQNEKI